MAATRSALARSTIGCRRRLSCSLRPVSVKMSIRCNTCMRISSAISYHRSSSTGAAPCTPGAVVGHVCASAASASAATSSNDGSDVRSIGSGDGEAGSNSAAWSTMDASSSWPSPQIDGSSSGSCGCGIEGLSKSSTASVNSGMSSRAVGATRASSICPGGGVPPRPTVGAPSSGRASLSAISAMRSRRISASACSSSSRAVAMLTLARQDCGCGARSPARGRNDIARVRRRRPARPCRRSRPGARSG